MRRRLVTLADLEPYQHLTRDEVIELQAKKIASMEDVVIKINFADYIRRFERENMSVTEFGGDTDYQKKIQTISERLREYASEAINNNKNL